MHQKLDILFFCLFCVDSVDRLFKKNTQEYEVVFYKSLSHGFQYKIY